MKVYIVAGEPSGDLLASGLMRALRRLVPGVKFRGVGGESMMATGAGLGSDSGAGAGLGSDSDAGAGLDLGVCADAGLGSGSGVCVDAGLGSGSGVCADTGLGSGSSVCACAGAGAGLGLGVCAGAGSGSGSGAGAYSGADDEAYTDSYGTDDERFKSLFDISEISVMGFFEVVPRLPLIMRRIRQTINDIEDFKPDVLVTVDSWGFVSALLTRLRKKWRREARTEGSRNGAGEVGGGENGGISGLRQIPVVHYVAPQVWAWKKGRARNVARLVDRLMTLLPDEGRWFERWGLRTDFVGHPVVERTTETALDPAGFRAANGIPADATVVTVLPGSRHSETKRLIPILKEAVERVAAEVQNIFVVVPTVPGVEKEVRRGFAHLSGRVPVCIVTGEVNRYNAFAISRLALAKSGTVSLELISFGVPHLIVYTFGRLSNLIARLLVKVRFANLINILADREIIPEFLLWRCRPDLIAEGAATLLRHPQSADRQIAEAADVMQRLRLPDVLPSDRAAQIVAEMAGRKKPPEDKSLRFGQWQPTDHVK